MGQHSLLIIFSIIIIFVGSFASFDFLRRAKYISGSKRILLIFTASVLFSLGLWIMQFIGLESIETTNFNFGYNAFYLTISLVFAVVTNFLLYLFISYSMDKKYKVISFIIGGIVLGFVFTAAHFIGMKAISKTEVMIEHNLNLVYLSIGIGILSSILALFTFIHPKESKFLRKLIPALLVSLGASGMHYTALFAMTLRVNEIPGNNQFAINSNILSIIIGLSTLLIISFIFIGQHQDRLILGRLRRHLKLEHESIIKNSPNFSVRIMKGDNGLLLNQVASKVLQCSMRLPFEELLNHFNGEFRKEFLHSFEHVKQGDFIELSKTTILNNSEYRFIMYPLMLEDKVYAVHVIGKDVTTQKRYERKLIEKEKELNDLINTQPGVIIKYKKIADRYIYTFAGGKLIGRFNFSPEDIIGKDLYELLPKEDVQEIHKFYEKAWNGEESFYEGKHNGISYIANLCPIKQNGQVTEVIVTLSDITSLKEAEEKISENLLLYRSALSNMSEGIIVYDESFKKIIANEKAAEIMGLSQDQLMEDSLENIPYQLLNKDGTPLEMEQYPAIITIKTGISLENVVVGIKRTNHSISWLEINSKPLYGKELLKGAVVTLSDITHIRSQEIELRKTNTMMSNYLNHLNSGVLVEDEHRKVTLINEDLCKMFGIVYTPFEIVGMTIFQFFNLVKNDLVDGEKCKLSISKIRELNTINTDIEFHHIDGRAFNLCYIPLIFKGKFKGGLWKIQDITVQKKTEASLIIAKDGAERANLAKSRFLSHMSHELRTPLNTIIGFSQLLEYDKENPLSSKQQVKLKKIMQAADHLLNLINEILDLSRIESGKMNISMEVLSLKDEIERAVTMIDPNMNGKDVEMMVDTSGTPDSYLFVDRTRFSQIMLNLLTNSIKYNKPHGKVIVSTSLQGERAIVYTEDTGIGIPVSEIENIFNPFYRLPSIHEPISGTGIGLSVVKELVEMMDGTYGVSSSLGEGSRFWVSFPIAKPPTNYFKKRKSTDLLNLDEKVSENTRSILYIEDNLLNLEMVRDFLKERNDVHFDYATSGVEGLKKALRNPPDLILLDLHMPDLTGFDVIQRLKDNEKTRPIRIIMVSASAEIADRKKAFQMGVEDYLSKPLDLNRLWTVVNDSLKKLISMN